jgi:hypothetical protein
MTEQQKKGLEIRKALTKAMQENNKDAFISVLKENVRDEESCTSCTDIHFWIQTFCLLISDSESYEGGAPAIKEATGHDMNSLKRFGEWMMVHNVHE